jgi:hypothetical protein
LRNGYEPGRIRTAEGAIGVQVPQVRSAAEPFRSTLMGFLEGNSDVLERLVTEMYARGLSTRDVEDAFRDATGELLISKSAVSEITDRLWEDYEAFCTRDLSDIDVEYLFVDAIFESLRRQGAKEALPVAWCVASDGRKQLLHVAVGNKESERCWTEFLRHMVDRGLRMPTTVTSDGAPGLVNAITAVFPRSVRIRCWFHLLANIRAKLPDESAADVMTHLYAVRDAPTLDAARPPPTGSRTPTGPSSPPRWPASPTTATPCGHPSRPGAPSHPGAHHQPGGTQLRRGTPAHQGHPPAHQRTLGDGARLRHYTRVAERWCRVSITDIERHQLQLLRAELGLDPPPAEDQPTRRTRRTKPVAA